MTTATKFRPAPRAKSVSELRWRSKAITKIRQATEEFLRGGWCHTGDIGFLDDQGYLHISGRKKNMIKSGGISVFPEEIEDTLRKHPDVADAAVIGFKSQEWGEAVKAFVVLNQWRRMQR